VSSAVLRQVKVNRFTELVQQDHENEQAEVRAKVAMEAGDEEAEKGFQGEPSQGSVIVSEYRLNKSTSARFHAGDS